MYNIKVNLLSVEVKIAARLILLFVPFLFKCHHVTGGGRGVGRWVGG